MIHGATLAAELDIASLPQGQVSNLLIEVIHDALGCAVRAPVIVARGMRTGPTFGITSALHGNELNGIPVIHRLIDRVDLRRLRGTIVAVVVVNVPAFLAHQRRYTDGVDLNHIMPGVPNGDASRVYAARVVDKFLRHFDYHLDLHTASGGRINSLYVRADMEHEVSAEMAYRQRPQIIVHNPASDSTLRGAAMERNIPAVTVEIGDPYRFQRRYIDRAVLGARSVLGQAGMLPHRPAASLGEPVLCNRSFWLYTDHGGLLTVHPGVTERVSEGDTLASLTDIFGRATREYKAPCDGIVIGKSVDPVAETGARILHIGVIAPAGAFGPTPYRRTQKLTTTIDRVDLEQAEY